MNIDKALNIEELRARFIDHTRRAYSLLPSLNQPAILDIGCGQGQQTVELARLSGGKVTGIDIDQDAVTGFQDRLERSSLGNRVKVLFVSLFNNNFENSSFDLLWAEGVLHLLDVSAGLMECKRLLKPGGFLMLHETIEWFNRFEKQLVRTGFKVVNHYLLPEHFWWTHYGAPLEGRIQILRELYGKRIESEKLSVYENIVSTIKENPTNSDCGFYLLQKAG